MWAKNNNRALVSNLFYGLMIEKETRNWFVLEIEIDSYLATYLWHFQKTLVFRFSIKRPLYYGAILLITFRVASQSMKQKVL